jgi:hypothetical protein
MFAVSARAKDRNPRSTSGRDSRSRILLTVLVVLAMLLILLRLGEFASHRIRHTAPRAAPAVMVASPLEVRSSIKTELRTEP